MLVLILGAAVFTYDNRYPKDRLGLFSCIGAVGAWVLTQIVAMLMYFFAVLLGYDITDDSGLFLSLASVPVALFVLHTLSVAFCEKYKIARAETESPGAETEALKEDLTKFTATNQGDF